MCIRSKRVHIGIKCAVLYVYMSEKICIFIVYFILFTIIKKILRKILQKLVNTSSFGLQFNRLNQDLLSVLIVPHIRSRDVTTTEKHCWRIRMNWRWSGFEVMASRDNSGVKLTYKDGLVVMWIWIYGITCSF